VCHEIKELKRHRTAPLMRIAEQVLIPDPTSRAAIEASIHKRASAGSKQTADCPIFVQPA
jgi:hypothetical protein